MTLAVDSGCKTLYLDETIKTASTYKNTAQPGSLLCIEKCSGGIFDQVQKTCFPISYFFYLLVSLYICSWLTLFSFWFTKILSFWFTEDLAV